MTRDGPCDMFALSDISAQVSVCLEAECKGWGVCLREREREAWQEISRTQNERRKKKKREKRRAQQTQSSWVHDVTCFFCFFFWRFFCVPHKQTERKKLKKPKAQKK